MSILRRLLLSITVAIVVILLGTLALSLNAARDYLAGQLQAQSTDAAVSLALTLSQPGNGDPVMQELLISGMFDGGRFSRIALTAPGFALDPVRAPLIVRQIEGQRHYDAPDWFRTMMPIDAKSATRTVTDGWRQIGDVTVTANDVYAWETLWASSLRMVWLVVVAGLAWTVFAVALVRWIERRVLAEISAEVHAIGQGKLQGSGIKPRVREFAGVIRALNQARAKLRITAAEQHAKVEALELELNRDEATGVANRRYFLNEFRRALSACDTVPADSTGSDTDDTSSGQGYIMVCHLRDLASINRQLRRKATDYWLTAICQCIDITLTEAGELSPPSRPLLARLNGADFAILMPLCDETAAQALAERIRRAVLDTCLPAAHRALPCRWVMAITRYDPGADISAVLTRLDRGLTQQEHAESDEIAVV